MGGTDEPAALSATCHFQFAGQLFASCSALACDAFQNKQTKTTNAHMHVYLYMHDVQCIAQSQYTMYGLLHACSMYA